MHATQNPDGSYSHRGDRYRLVERQRDAATLDVVRDGDGAVAGSLRVTGTAEEPAAVVLPGATLPEPVQAIAKLLGAPRGALPLQ
jgi:hypothetical protein